MLRKALAMRGIHWLATRFGSGSLRRMSFDEMFRSGNWNFAATPSSELVKVVEKYSLNGDILMLGCGTGTIAGALAPQSFRSFLGVDLSPEAIAKANTLAGDTIRFEVGDMLQYEPAGTYEIILFSEALYYAWPWQRKPLLRKLQKRLKQNGKFIVTIAQPTRYASIIKMIRNNFQILEDRQFLDSGRHLLVFH